MALTIVHSLRDIWFYQLGMQCICFVVIGNVFMCRVAPNEIGKHRVGPNLCCANTLLNFTTLERACRLFQRGFDDS